MNTKMITKTQGEKPEFTSFLLKALKAEFQSLSPPQERSVIQGTADFCRGVRFGDQEFLP